MCLFQVIGMDRRHPRHWILIGAIAGSPPGLFISRTEIKDLIPCRRHHPKNFTNVLRQLAKLLLAALQGVLGLLAFGDIPKEPYPPQALPPAASETARVAFECPAVPQLNLAMVARIR